METIKSDILISGAGIPGLALAILLGRFGLNISMVDPFPPLPLKKTKPDGRTSALMSESLQILEHTGALPRCEDYTAPLETMRIIDRTRATRKKNLLEVNFHADEINKPYFGKNYPNAILRAALFDEMKTVRNIRFIKKAAIADYHTTGTHAIVTLDNGKTIKTKLLVGADGRSSKTRELAGIEYIVKDYGQKAITCLINHSKSHKNISTEFHTPSGPFTIVPMPGNQSSIVWVDFNDKADAFMAMNKTAFEQALEDRSGGIVGSVSLASTPSAWPLKSATTKSLISDNIALIAESAHILHPLGAQGLNLSLRDVAALAEVIADAARSGMDIASKQTLTTYENRRKNDIILRSIAVDGLHSLMISQSSLTHRIKQSGLQAIDRLPSLKNMIMHKGLTGAQDNGRLSSGHAL